MVGSRPRRKPPNRYHHGDLPRALLNEAATMIQAHGVDRLTLRALSDRLGVSRTALYRHFADKSALLAAVGREGFRTLRTEVVAAREAAGSGLDGLDAMALAYVRFALTHPANYRVMFGGFADAGAKDPRFVAEASAAFNVLVETVVALQGDDLVRKAEPRQLARFVWATLHGVAMLGIDGQLKHQQVDARELIQYVVDRLRPALAPGS